ncbi:MAG: N-6 DNA methylase [Bacteroidales bacterium]|nr:N-6 DNA methylase [Bacteroidales bacterium]
MDHEILKNLKDGPEQQLVVGPLVEILVSKGWNLKQIIFGKKEWKVPKTPSEASKREAGRSFAGFPVDIAVFDCVENANDYRHLLFIIECKKPGIEVGQEQLETYLSLEPHAKLGVVANNAEKSSKATFVYKDKNGINFPQERTINDLPGVNDSFEPDAVKFTYNDLIIPSKSTLFWNFGALLDNVVSRDGFVTRREQQLDQLCNLLLLKLDSDKLGKISPDDEVYFHPLSDEKQTAKYIKDKFDEFVPLYSEIFLTDTDKKILFDDTTIQAIVDGLYKFNLLEIGPDAVSIAFQVLRSAALKQEEGQYFTPKQVIQAAIKLTGLNLNDIIIDPACGTGGFLIQALIDMEERYPKMQTEISKWAQLRLFGIDKDSIGVKLTKAIMQILQDGSAHCVKGDSVLTHTWEHKYHHLMSNDFKNGRFTKVFTNPPFGVNLTIPYKDAVKAKLSIADYFEPGEDIELGLTMFNRCLDLVKEGGVICIVLPETYFFSPSYKRFREWVKERMKPLCVANVPMDAFQGFCRAKTNLYIFEKLFKDKSNLHIESDFVSFLNPQTCGIYKNGSTRFIIGADGQRTNEIDNKLWDYAVEYANHDYSHCFRIPLKDVYEADVIVPQYFDNQYNQPSQNLRDNLKIDGISLGELIDQDIISISGGHGSPSNDVRKGSIPYVKVSDIRNLRINVNPTNLVPFELAKKFWKTKDGKSNLCAWDLISPSRASSNIGEFAILLPGEENIVLTKEVFVIRVKENQYGYTPFYLLWSLSLQETRMQWSRITLMQTNREDVGQRYREIIIPKPPSKEWAEKTSLPFKQYFSSLAESKKLFGAKTAADEFNYIASVSAYNN